MRNPRIVNSIFILEVNFHVVVLCLFNILFPLGVDRCSSV